VLENAVVYEAMNPSRAKVSRGSTPLSHFIKVPAPMPVTPLPSAPVDSAPADGFVSQPVVQQIPPEPTDDAPTEDARAGRRVGGRALLALWQRQGVGAAGGGEPARPCAGRPLPFCAEVVVCGHPHPGARVLADRPAPDMGPLGGLNAALHEALAGSFDGVLVTGCDMPSFPLLWPMR
jgi:hypothetical protein